MGMVRLSLDGDTISSEGPIAEDTVYEAYDRIGSLLSKEAFEPSAAIADYLERLGRVVSVDGARFSYHLTPHLMRVGDEATCGTLNSRFSLPGEWRFQDFTLADVAAVAKALWFFSYSHFSARLVAMRQGCQGLGIRDALIVTRPRALVRRLAQCVASESERVARVVEVLTYGTGGQRSPDPALQPVMTLGSHVVVSPNVMIDSAMERNFSVLLNRLDDYRDAYSRLSRLRESILRDEFVREVRELGLRAWHGVIPEWGPAGEIDLVLVCDRSQARLVWN